MRKEIPQGLIDLVTEVSTWLARDTGDNYKFFLMVFPKGGVVNPKDGTISSDASRDEVIRAMKIFIENCEKDGNEAKAN